MYHSALPFSPSKSWLRESYGSGLSQKVKVVKGLQAEWGRCFRTVPFNHVPLALACWSDIIAAGLQSGNITLLNAITGITMSILSGHNDDVNSLVFSLDGTFLVSGSDDKTVKLWDVQTGGVIKTFYGQTYRVYSVSISPDCTMIASGSGDRTICLWDTQAGVCCCVIDGHKDFITSVSFSPLNPQLLISASHDHTICLWDIQMGVNDWVTNRHDSSVNSSSTIYNSPVSSRHFPTPPHSPASPLCLWQQKIGVFQMHHFDCNVSFSPGGTHFVSWIGMDAVIWDSTSRAIVSKLQVSNEQFECCCFSPNGNFLAGSAGCTVYVWYITSSDPHLVETFIGHTDTITSLTFSSSLISSSNDGLIMFWQSGALSTDLVIADSEQMTSVLVPVKSVHLQADNGIVFTTNSTGVVRAWDILTGLCKATFQTPIKSFDYTDIWLMGSRLILVWYNPIGTYIERANGDFYIWELYTWDTSKENPYQSLEVDLDRSDHSIVDLRISGDGSKVFLLSSCHLQVSSVLTGKEVGRVDLSYHLYHGPLVVDNSRVWVYAMGSQSIGWDFSTSHSPPISLSCMPPKTPKRPHPNPFNATRGQVVSLPRIFNITTGKKIPIVWEICKACCDTVG